MTEQQARAFIRQQLADYELAGITTMTARQRERIEQLSVVSDRAKQRARVCLSVAARFHGPAPRQSTGRMRVLNMRTGEIETRRA